MAIKKITGTRSYMVVDFGKKSIKIEGELTLTPAFYGYINSIKNWEPPYEKEEISDLEKQQIIEEIANYNNPEFKIFLEDW